MSGEGFTSNSKSGVICKAVIDFSYYKSLLEAERLRKLNFQKQTKAQEIKVKPLPSQTQPSTASTSGGTQVGEGAKCHCVGEEKLRSIIKEELTHFLKPETEVAVRQQGSGNAFDPDETPAADKAEVQLDANSQPQTAIVQELDHVEPLVANKAEFLKLIPNKWQKFGHKLLDFLETNPMYINWNSNNEVTVNGTQIPDSNIYEIFKELYAEHPDSNVSGYIIVASLLMDLGLGYLFRKTNFLFLNRNKMKIGDIQMGHGNDWFYIGDL